MPKRVTGTTFDRATFVKRGAVRDPNNPSEPFGRLLWKAEEDTSDNGDASVPSPTPKGAPMTSQEYQEALAKAEKERDEALAKQQEAEEALAKASKKSDDDKSDDEKNDDETKDKFVKSELPEPVRVALEKAEKEAEELRKEAKEAQEIAKAERHARETREFISKAESEFSHLGKAEDVGPMLMKLRDSLSKEDYEAQVDLWKEQQRLHVAAQEQIAKGELFGELGVGGRAAPDKTDGVKTTIAKAEELRKNDPSLSEAEAFRRAARDPEVQKAHLAERG